MPRSISERVSALEVKAENKDIHTKLDAIHDLVKDNKENIKGKLSSKIFYTLLIILTGILGYMTKTVYAMQSELVKITTELGISMS